MDSARLHTSIRLSIHFLQGGRRWAWGRRLRGDNMLEGKCGEGEGGWVWCKLMHFSIGTCEVFLESLQSNISSRFLFVSGLLRGDTINLIIQDIQLVGNSNRHGLQRLDLNDGLLMFVSVYHVTINGTGLEECQFNNLLGPVVVLRSAMVYLTGTMLFTDIRASTWADGAAIQIQTNAALWLQEPLYAEFSNSSAVKGGAIASVQLVTEFCAFQYQTQGTYTEHNITEMDVSLVFSGNKAVLAGNSVFVDGLYSCSTRISSSLEGLIDKQIIYNAIFQFKESVNNGLPEMTSTQNRICLCTGELNNTAKLSCAQNAPLEITTYPGQDFTVPIICVDEIMQPVFSNVYNRLLPQDGDDAYYNNFNWRLGSGQDIMELYSATCTPVNYTILMNSTVYTSEYSQGILSIYPSGKVDCLAVPVVLNPCPYGYQLDKTHGNCQCSRLLRRYGFTCDINTGVTRPSPESWVGVVSNGTLIDGNWSFEEAKIGYSTDCPEAYCTRNLQVNLSDPSTICRYDRVGILCGQCPEGESAVIGSAVCQKCSNWWLLTLPIFALLGIVLVFFLFLLRLTVATGTINGLIFYANIYNLTTHHLLDYKSTLWLSAFINFLNLELGFPLCFFDGLTPLTATYLSFIVPIYLWLLVLALIVLSRYIQIVARLIYRSAIPVLATIIHLSFSKLMSFVVNCLTVIHLDVEDAHGKASHRHVWYFDGSVEYFGKRHIGMFCLSLFSLILFLLPYIIFLTGIKWFSRFHLANRVRPFVDAYCAPFKDKWRFWFGARLWVLILFHILSVSMKNYPYILTLVKCILITLFTITQVAIMPYKNILVNLLDAFFLVDLTLIYIVTLYDANYEVLCNLFVIPVFLVFCLIIAYHVHLVTGRSKRIRQMLFKKTKMSKMSVELEDSTQVTEDESERSSLVNTPKPAATYSTLLSVNDAEPPSVYHYKPGVLREPLLESDSDNSS
jgi:transcription initiation factor TFIID subunit 2/histone acetyltransferase MYST3